MKSVWKPALFFVFCLGITLLINTPAGHLVARLKIPENITISPLQGSLFKGRTDTLGVNQLTIHDLEYQFKLSCLITASLCYQIDFDRGSALIRFVPITGSIEVSQLNIELSMSDLTGLPNKLLIQPSGSLILRSDNLKFMQAKLIDIDAVVVWKNAGIAGEDINLGDYQLNIIKDSGQYRINLVDKEAVLDVEGQGELKSDGRYSFEINILTKAGLDARIKNALEFVASKKGLRQYHVRRSGVSKKRLLSYLSFESI